MGLFSRKKPDPDLPKVSLEEYEPVIRSSICTGEKTACLRHRESGKLRELICIRNEDDMETFCVTYGVRPEQVRTIY